MDRSVNPAAVLGNTESGDYGLPARTLYLRLGESWKTAAYATEQL
jgi:hypothetical protein